MNETAQKPSAAERLAKVMARHGLCSRRQAEQWIRDGRVSVNGQKVMTPAFTVTNKDKVEVDGAPLAYKTATRLWLYHKPAGLVVTERDPEGRPTIYEKFEEAGLPRVLTVGRLDINTEGLLLLTNDGGLKRILELPATGWLRRYRVRAYGTITQEALDKLKSGIEVEGVKYGSIDATLERVQGSNVWLLVALREGKNREVKNVLSALGLTVNRLIRISYGPFQLGDMPSGQLETVRTKVLRDQLGVRLAEEAGVDFEGEVPEAEQLPAPRRAEASQRRGPGPRRADVKSPARSEPDKARRHEGGRKDREPDGRGHRGFERRDSDARGGKGGDRREPDARGGKGADRRGPGQGAGARGRDGFGEGRPKRAPKIHFDDGRPPEDYVAPTGKQRPDDRRGPSGGPRQGHNARPHDGKPHDGKPRDGKPRDGRPGDNRPRDGKPRDGRPGDNRPRDGKLRDGKPRDSRSRDGKPPHGRKGPPKGPPRGR